MTTPSDIRNYYHDDAHADENPDTDIGRVRSVSAYRKAYAEARADLEATLSGLERELGFVRETAGRSLGMQLAKFLSARVEAADHGLPAHEAHTQAIEELNHRVQRFAYGRNPRRAPTSWRYLLTTCNKIVREL